MRRVHEFVHGFITGQDRVSASLLSELNGADLCDCPQGLWFCYRVRPLQSILAVDAA
jgi:hypothetical protein